MKTNIVAMPHMVENAGDICICQSVVDDHPGNMWLYYFLPRMARVEAIRLVLNPEHAKQQDATHPRLFQWNGFTKAPTLYKQLSNDQGDAYQLTLGELIEVEGTQRKFL